MNIQLSTSTTEGTTKLSAFDAALHACGVDNYNLLRLSSVIPPKSVIQVCDGPVDKIPNSWGDKLYVVMAEYRQDEPGKEAWAGIGWVQSEDDNRGLFVEHESDSREQVESDIEASLKDLMKTRGIDYGEIKMVVAGGVCKDKPICALAVAKYENEGWRS